MLTALEETPLSVFQDDDELLRFKILKEEDGNTAPYDLTGATIEFIVKNDADSSTLFDYTTTASEITITSATGGVFTVQFARGDVANAGNYRYSIRVTQSSKRRTVGYGTLEVINV